MAEKRTKVEKEQRKADYLEKQAVGRPEPETIVEETTPEGPPNSLIETKSRITRWTQNPRESWTRCWRR